MYLNTFDDSFLPQVKDILRKQMRQRKRQLTQIQKLADEKAVFGAIEASGILRTAQHILLYHSLADELPTHATLECWRQSGRNIYLPRVAGNDIEVVPYTGPESLSDDNTFHIEEPLGDSVEASILDAVIVPGVAFDCNCNRMGRGRGYYDRLLSSGHLLTIGVCHDCQLINEVPCEPHDRPLDYVFTPNNIFSRNKRNND